MTSASGVISIRPTHSQRRRPALPDKRSRRSVGEYRRRGVDTLLLEKSSLQVAPWGSASGCPLFELQRVKFEGPLPIAIIGSTG
jgi:hypothetical protein